jgi:nucleoside-diphosphate-sugar epimerase
LTPPARQRGIAPVVRAGRGRFCSARRVGDVLATLLARSSAAIAVETEAARLRPTDVERVAGDASRARALLGWQPRQDWDETLDLILADWRARVAGGE